MKYELTNAIAGSPSPNRMARRAQAAKECSAKTPDRVLSGPLTDESLDPWGRQLKMLGVDNPMSAVRHPAGWAIVQCSGLYFQICGGPFSSRTEAREVMDEWASKERWARTTDSVPSGPAPWQDMEELTPPDDDSHDPWGRQLEILCYDAPLDLAHHPVGWVILQFSENAYNVCDGPFATRLEAREAMEAWLELRRSMKIWKAELTPEKV